MSAETSHTVVIDATAGAEGGLAAVRAAAAASLDLHQEMVLVGDESVLTAALAEIAHDAERLRVLHAPERLPQDALAESVLDQAPRSPIPVGLSMLARSPHASFVTAGQPGSVVKAAARYLDKLPGVNRAVLCSVVPTLRFRGERDDPFALVLDVGANARASADDLLAFATMGAAYARLISVVERPKVGLLSHSRNPNAVPRALQQAHRVLSGGDEDFEYVGLMLADRIALGDADVIVTEGFAGNVVIRTLEGVAQSAEQLLSRARERFTWRVGVSMLGSGVNRLRAIADWENYGGAPLLGFDRTVIITHEEAGTHALLNAIRLAAKVERLGVRSAIAPPDPSC